MVRSLLGRYQRRKSARRRRGARVRRRRDEASAARRGGGGGVVLGDLHRQGAHERGQFVGDASEYGLLIGVAAHPDEKTSSLNKGKGIRFKTFSTLLRIPYQLPEGDGPEVLAPKLEDALSRTGPSEQGVEPGKFLSRHRLQQDVARVRGHGVHTRDEEGDKGKCEDGIRCIVLAEMTR